MFLLPFLVQYHKGEWLD
ncbi:hypothetical protein OIU76_028880 [Salix suchowensis]|nr:hypothetical protein OIU76_028880 [Salix suchowensis]